MDLSGISSALGLLGGLFAACWAVYHNHIFDDNVKESLLKNKDFMRNYIKDCLVEDQEFLSKIIRNSPTITFIHGRINSRKLDIRNLEIKLLKEKATTKAFANLHESSSVRIAELIVDLSLRLEQLIDFYNAKNPQSQFRFCVDNRTIKEQINETISDMFNCPLIVREALRREREKISGSGDFDPTLEDEPLSDFRSTMGNDA